MKRFLVPKAAKRGSSKQMVDKIEQAVAKKARKVKSAAAPPPPPAAAATPTSLIQNGWTDLEEEAQVGYWPRMLSGISQSAMQALLNDIQWQQRDLVIFGRTVAQPRLIAYMADPTTPPYTYSGLTLQPMPWAEVVLQVKAAVEQLQPGTTYNSCLLNLYRDGSHHVSWHADNEKLYGDRPSIASVSFGAPRDFVLRHNLERSRKISTTLSAGDVLIMTGTTQQHWQHSIPKRKGISQPRINLTFRTILDT